MEYTSGNPPNSERGGLGPSREDTEQYVDNVFLTNENRHKKVGDNSVGNPSGVCLVGRRKANKYGHVSCKGDTEKPSVNGEEHIADIPDWLGVLLPDVLVVEITLPVEGFLFVRNILRRAA